MLEMFDPVSKNSFFFTQTQPFINVSFGTFCEPVDVLKIYLLIIQKWLEVLQRVNKLRDRKLSAINAIFRIIATII